MSLSSAQDFDQHDTDANQDGRDDALASEGFAKQQGSDQGRKYYTGFAQGRSLDFAQINTVHEEMRYDKEFFAVEAQDKLPVTWARIKAFLE